MTLYTRSTSSTKVLGPRVCYRIHEAVNIVELESLFLGEFSPEGFILILFTFPFSRGRPCKSLGEAYVALRYWSTA